MIKCGRPAKGNECLSRDRLLDAALKLFLEHGYGKLNMETIARDARVSLRTIYTQFGGKAGLFGALIRRYSDQFVADLSDEETPEQALLVFAQKYLSRITQPDAVRIRAILIAESPSFPDLATEFYQQGAQRTLDHLTDFFITQQAAGYFIPLEPDFLAQQFISALRGDRLQQLQLGLTTTPDEQEIKIWAQQATQLFLYGCLTDKARQIADLSDAVS
jgi:TetR/AcrR family transcriptional regulator, mexJK operon transcriptional repressor